MNLISKRKKHSNKAIAGLLATVIFCGQSILSAQVSRAQGPATPASSSAPSTTGPVDIQANEQEFAGDHIIAHGNVHVTYKDSIVIAPEAILYRDESGNAQKAVFTGHPYLIQGSNKMDGDTLTLEIANSSIIAQGNSHSEVLQNDPEPAAPPTKGQQSLEPKKGTKISPKTQDKSKVSAQNKSKIVSKTEVAPKATGGAPFKWPQANDDSAQSDVTQSDKVASADVKQDSSTNGNSADKATGDKAKGKTAESSAPEKIYTDADRQEFDRSTGKFDAFGHVKVKHGDITVHADKLRMVYGSDNKPETAIFNGHVSAIQNDNNTKSDQMIYFLTTKRLQATGNVKSKVIQKKEDATKKAEGGPKKLSMEGGTETSDQKPKLIADAGAAAAATPPATESAKTSAGTPPEEDKPPIFINSDAQDYNSDTGRMTAEGNVHVYHGETTAIGPEMIMLRNEDGKAEKMIFIGRSQVSQPGKRWIGDHITMIVDTNKILARGNTKAVILQNNNENNSNKPGHVVPALNSSPTLAKSPSSGSGNQLAATKIEATK